MISSCIMIKIQRNIKRVLVTKEINFVVNCPNFITEHSYRYQFLVTVKFITTCGRSRHVKWIPVTDVLYFPFLCSY